MVTEYIEIIIMALAIVIVVQAIIMLGMSRKLKKITRSYRSMMDGTGVENLEGVLVSLKEEQRQEQKDLAAAFSRIEALEKRVPLQKSKMAIHRYNAFSNTGSDLSFSLAITNDEKDGVVLTSIHSREGMYLYGKPLQKGESSYSLTPEERKVIDEAK
ncbi:DUF4446 family protein [Paenibacillus camelliae]|uniref:DUF4446 family protein n=1 Tax=Paenibacillus camelliae TaxID=512410 RepID=UPI00203C6036|nr:DUF4446 family protein [Paenibacillus camelliae]MCM3635614.1 DUF4446 family protein [Paenibacillus camelliae]